MTKTRIVFVLVPAVLFAGSLFSRGSGTIPGVSSIPSDAARNTPSCTGCHSGTVGASGAATSMTIAQVSLAMNEVAQVTIQVSGGPSGTRGGFAAENSGGAFAAGSTSHINTTGRIGQFITHNNASNRTWAFPYTASATPGLYLLYTVGMAANNSSSTSGDVIAFNGFDATATVCTPVYVGVNATGTQRFGQGCRGSYGNYPVLYSDVVPSVGNASYALKLAGAAASSNALFLIGTPRATPLDLGLIGATGCSLWVDPLASMSTTTSAGHPQRGEGTATQGLAIPNTTSLRGAILAAQCAIVDPANGRGLPITMSDGLLFQIQ